jgi:hypothetical protein
MTSCDTARTQVTSDNGRRPGTTASVDSGCLVTMT